MMIGKETNRQPVVQRRLLLALPLVLLLAALTVLLMWQQSPTELAQASSEPCGVNAPQPCGMALGVELASGTPDCDDATNPTACTFTVNQPFVLTIKADPAPDVDIAGFNTEVLFPVSPELGPCDNRRDDDGDLAINDGCIAVGEPEKREFCYDTEDDDSDGTINDGCPAKSTEETGSACDPGNTADEDNDGAVNDGCPAIGEPEAPHLEPPFCLDDADQDGDGVVNDGCPQVGTVPEFDECANDTDDDFDDRVNDGCPQVGNFAESGEDCLNDTDDDVKDIFGGRDGFVNDGCPAAGTGPEVDQCANETDDDGDGAINDGCPVVGPVGEASACDGGADDDLDGAPNDGCPQRGPTAETGSLCADNVDNDNDGFLNDGCPAAGTREETGAACAQGNTVDDDKDGFVNDGCPAVPSALGAETGTACNQGNTADEDGDGFVNDGCPAQGTLGETDDQCVRGDSVDDDNDGRFNDGCPPAGAELLYQRLTCLEEVQVVIAGAGDPLFCVSADTGIGSVIHAVSSELAAPARRLDVTPGSTGTILVALAFTCNLEGIHKVTLGAVPDSGQGAVYADVNAQPLFLKTVAEELDVDFDGVPEMHQVADTLSITCGNPPTPTSTPTPTATPTAPPTPTTGPSPTPTATSTAGPSPTPTATSPAGPTATPTETHPEEPDVAVTLTDSADPVESEGKITYTLLVRNLGLQAAENVEVKDILPAGAIFLGPALGCSHASGVVTCTLPSLGGYDSRPGGLDEETIFIQITAPKVLPDFERIINEVWVSASNEPPENGGNNHDVEETIVLGQGPDLTVEKTASPNFIDVGGTVDYNVTVRNVGPVAAEGIELEDALPPLSEATFVSASAGCAHASGVVTCALGSLPPDGQISIQIQLNVPDVTRDLLLRNEARVSATNERFWDTGNNLAVAHTPVVALPPELSVVKTGPQSVLRVREYSYTLTMINQGGGDALDIVVTDPLPPLLTFVFTSHPDECGTPGIGNVLTCVIPVVPANGGQVVITIRVRAPNASEADLQLINEATVIDADEGIELHSSALTMIQACVDLTDDDAIGFLDYLALLRVFGAVSSIPDSGFDLIFDLNKDGAITLLDFLQLQQHFNEVC